jgi:vitamin B12 transporter
MKRLLLSAAIVAMAGPAWAQVQADYEQQVKTDIEEQLAKDIANGTITIGGAPSFNSDLIVVAAERIGASRADQLTSPASVITATDIRARNQSTIADLLRTVPGLAVSQNGGAGSLTQIRLRGSEANHIVVIIDGVEVANPADGAFDFGGLHRRELARQR